MLSRSTLRSLQKNGATLPLKPLQAQIHSTPQLSIHDALNSVRSALSGSPFEAFYFPHKAEQGQQQTTHVRVIRSEETEGSLSAGNATASNATTTATPNPYAQTDAPSIANFQICLWISIILFVTVLVFVCHMSSMGGSGDSLLYRQSHGGPKHIHQT